MPLSINVGLSRKASKDYQSTGVSINVTAELDQSLLSRPDELQQQIGSLYAQAERALDQQAGAPVLSRPQPATGRAGRNGNGRSPRNGDGYANGGGRNGHDRNGGGNGAMTDSQRRAINSIATRLNVDPQVESREIIGADMDSLSLR